MTTPNPIGDAERLRLLGVVVHSAAVIEYLAFSFLAELVVQDADRAIAAEVFDRVQGTARLEALERVARMRDDAEIASWARDARDALVIRNRYVHDLLARAEDDGGYQFVRPKRGAGMTFRTYARDELNAAARQLDHVADAGGRLLVRRYPA
jgi:hypothetical protein